MIYLLLILIFRNSRFFGFIYHWSWGSPYGLAMIVLSVTVVLTMYLLAVGRRWVAAVLAAGAMILTLAVLAVHGVPRSTALVDLAVQSAVLAVILIGFVFVHRVRMDRELLG